MTTTRIKRKMALISSQNNTPEGTPRAARTLSSYLRTRTALSTFAPKNPIAKMRKKIKPDDRVFRPRASKPSSQGSTTDVLSMRCDRSITVNEKNVKLVTTFLVDTADIRDNNLAITPKSFNRKLTVVAQNSKSYRPIKQVLKLNALGSPVQVAVSSPSDRKKNYIVTRDAKIGPVSLYSNREQIGSPNSKMVTRLDAQSDFYQSQQYRTIQKHFAAIKKQKITVTEKLLNKTARENKTSHSSRNQNEVMFGRAKAYAEATHLFVNDLKWEWLHLVAHQIAGNESQHPNNLVAGTYHANTLMIFVERELKQLAERYPEGFTLEIKAHLMQKEDHGIATGEHLQIATQLEYRIITPDFNILFPFNAQNPNQPHLDYKHYVHALFAAITGNIPQATNSSTSDTSAISHCFKRK